MVEIETISIMDIIPSDYNPRLISDEEFTKLNNSINEWGLVDPIIINLKNMHIIGGHQRFSVLLDKYDKTGDYAELSLFRKGDIGWLFTDETFNIKNNSHEMGLNVALNKISGEWDYPKLNDLLEDLSLDDTFDISLTGFDSLDVSNMELLDVDLDDLDIGEDGMTANDFVGTNKLQLYVKFKSIESQEELYERLTGEGYSCKIYSSEIDKN